MGLFTPRISAQQMEQVKILLKQANESAKLLNATVKPDVFFGRLHFLLDVLLELQKYEKYKIFSGSLPSSDYRKITGNLENTVNDFLDRAIANNKQKISSLKTEAARHKNYTKFVSELNQSFLSANTYWQGNMVYPHYNGHLYTSANFLRVQQLLNSSAEPDLVSQEMFSKYGGVDAILLTIDLMEGHEFEYWFSELLSDIGFSNIRVTPGSGDHGVDVLAEKDGIKYAIQCKRYTHDLGNTPVQEVFAGKNMYNCHVGAVITNQHFTSGAKQLAQATGVLLWDREWIKNYLENHVSDSQHKPAAINLTSNNLFSTAVEIILETKQASISILQRRLNIGYAQAARLMDELEANSIVGPFQGSRPRDILITRDQWNSR